MYRHADTPLIRGLAGGYLAAIMGVLVHAIGSNTFIIIRVMEPFWLIAAVVLAMPRLAETEEAAARAAPARPGPWRPTPQTSR